MSRAFSCPHCKKPFELTDEQMSRGKAAGQIDCPHCHAAIKVRKPAPVAAATTAAASADEPSPFGGPDLDAWSGADDPLAMPLAGVPLQPAPLLTDARPFPAAAASSGPRVPATASRTEAPKKSSSMSPAAKIGIAAGAGGALLLGLLCCGGGVVAFSMSGLASADSSDAGGGDIAASEASLDEPLPPVVENFPPTPWTVTFSTPPEMPAMADIIDAGTSDALYLFPGCRDRFIRKGQILSTNPASGHTYDWLLVSFDPATGKPVGEPISLGGEVTATQPRIGPSVPYRADVSPDGALAIATAGTVSILEPGAKALRPLNLDDAYRDWFGWAKDGRLLIVQGGKLHFWKIDGTEPALSVGEKYAGPVALTPARDIVFVTVDQKYLEAVDAITGEVRGRLGAHGQWKFLSVSPDGKRLAGVHWAEAWIPAPSSSPYEGRYDVVAFDLATGKEISSVSARSYGPPATWVGPNHVYHDGKVFDFESRAPIVALGMPRFAKPDYSSSVPALVASPDGRMWWTMEFGQAFYAPVPLEPKNGVKAFDASTPIKLEVVSFDSSRNAQVEQTAKQALSSGGRAVGSGAWTIRIQLDRSESDVLLYDDKSTMKAPKIDGQMKLVSPEGALVSTIYFGGSFNRDKTAYLAKKDDKDWQNPDTTIYTFDFGSLDPDQAILKECWAQAIDVLKSIKRLPIVYQVDGKYVELPAPVPLEVPAGVRTRGDAVLMDPRTGKPILDPRTGMPIPDPGVPMPSAPGAGPK